MRGEPPADQIINCSRDTQRQSLRKKPQLHTVLNVRGARNLSIVARKDRGQDGTDIHG